MTKLKVHVEDVTILVKNVTKHIVANKNRNYANDASFVNEEVAIAA